MVRVIGVWWLKTFTWTNVDHNYQWIIMPLWIDLLISIEENTSMKPNIWPYLLKHNIQLKWPNI